MSERVALVTGASDGIGRAVALDLARRCRSVWLVARRADALAAVRDAAGELAPALRPAPADLTRDADVRELARGLERAGGRLDVLVQCAARIEHGPVESAGLEDFDAQHAINLRARYALVQATLPLLRKARGEVVFVNSTAALRPRAGLAGYAAAYAGLRALADSLRDEVNADGVRVTSVFPGRTATPSQRAIHAHEGRDYRPELLIQPEDVAAMVAAAIELPRTAEVTEIRMRPFTKPPDA